MSPTAMPRPVLRTTLRRPGDALSRASIGGVPILWDNTIPAADCDEAHALRVLDELARLGYDGTALGAGAPAGAGLERQLTDRSLRLAEVYAALPATIDGPTPEALDGARERLRRLDDAGGDVFVLAVDGSPDRDAWAGRADDPGAPRLTDEGWRRLAEVLHTLADEAAALGHPTAFHPHGATLIETPAEVDRLVSETDPARIGICLDVGHHLVGGGDPVATIRALGERVTHLHLKDVDGRALARLRDGTLPTLSEAVRVERIFTELGAGILDLDGVLEALDDRGYAGWLMVEQDTCWEAPSESAAIGRRVLAATLRSVGRAGERAAA
jgi:inosose dehydratase